MRLKKNIKHTAACLQNSKQSSISHLLLPGMQLQALQRGLECAHLHLHLHCWQQQQLRLVLLVLLVQQHWQLQELLCWMLGVAQLHLPAKFWQQKCRENLCRN
jgi:hypothetical protein